MTDLPPPPPSSAPQPGGWQQQPPQQIVVKQGPGCLKIGLIVAAVLVLFGIGVVGCLALAGNEVAKEIDKSMGEAAASDYAITDLECVTDDMLGLKATGKIKNLSDKAQGFQITVRWETEGGDLISEDPEFTDTIKVGQAQGWEAISLKDAPEGSKPVCEVAKVEYSIFDNEGD